MYNLVKESTGELLSNSNGPINNVADGNIVVETPDNKGVWNTSTLAYDAHPPTRIISASDFILRFTDTERDDLIEVAKTVKKANTFIKILPILGVADLDSGFITGAVTKMVQGNILTASRATEILSDG